MDVQSDISAWVSRIPKVTRWWFFSAFFLPLTTKLGIISPMYLVLLPEAVSGFQVSYAVLFALCYLCDKKDVVFFVCDYRFGDSLPVYCGFL